MTDEIAVSDLKTQLLASFNKQQVSRDNLNEFASWHPVSLPKHLTQALAQLQTAGAIADVVPKAGRRGFWRRRREHRKMLP